jgi:hypothetical protein
MNIKIVYINNYHFDPIISELAFKDNFLNLNLYAFIQKNSCIFANNSVLKSIEIRSSNLSLIIELVIFPGKVKS